MPFQDFSKNCLNILILNYLYYHQICITTIWILEKVNFVQFNKCYYGLQYFVVIF